MAKTGIVNTNLLDRLELERLISEIQLKLPNMRSLQYIQTERTVSAKGNILEILARSASSEGKQIDLKFKNFILNEDETYRIIENCFTIGNATIYEKSRLKKLLNDSCESRLFKAGNADCHFIKNNASLIELI